MGRPQAQQWPQAAQQGWGWQEQAEPQQGWGWVQQALAGWQAAGAAPPPVPGAHLAAGQPLQLGPADLPFFPQAPALPQSQLSPLELMLQQALGGQQQARQAQQAQQQQQQQAALPALPRAASGTACESTGVGASAAAEVAAGAAGAAPVRSEASEADASVAPASTKDGLPADVLAEVQVGGAGRGGAKPGAAWAASLCLHAHTQAAAPRCPPTPLCGAPGRRTLPRSGRRAVLLPRPYRPVPIVLPSALAGHYAAGV